MEDRDVFLQTECTADGSPTLYHPVFGERYHSIHGAIQESRHVFIASALEHRAKTIGDHSIRILECGLGTGLNAVLSFLWAKKYDISIHYHGVELYPLREDIYSKLSYRQLGEGVDEMLMKIHYSPWGEDVICGDGLLLHKSLGDWREMELSSSYDVIYYDAFSPEVQPELWVEEVFARLYMHSKEGAILCTYCAKGEVRRRMQRAGWMVERIAGPPGKREMLRASKVVAL